MSGYCSMGRLLKPITPNIRMSTEMAHDRMGLSIKVFSFIMSPPIFQYVTKESGYSPESVRHPRPQLLPLPAISGQEGFDYLKQILRIDPQAVVVFMTAYADTGKAVQAIKAGATDFISKPWEKEKLLATLSAAVKLSRSRQEVGRLQNEVQALKGDDRIPELIGNSPAMQKVKETIYKLSDTDANLLILGENGTGKDLAARMLRFFSPRREQVFIPIDLGSIPEQLFESELFGYEKGAFTDARKAKPGRMETASGGTAVSG